MTLKALKSEISELHAGQEQRYSNKKMSANGILYTDPRPLIYCTEYNFIPGQLLEVEHCRKCGIGKDILELTEENREMWLDCDGNVQDENRGASFPITAHLIVATIQVKPGQTEKKKVYNHFGDAKRCPRGW